MLDPKCIYGKSIFAKCTRLVFLLSFASLFTAESRGPNYFRPLWQEDLLVDKTNIIGKELVMEGGGREAVRRAYDELRLAHPELPFQLRDFQVA